MPEPKRAGGAGLAAAAAIGLACGLLACDDRQTPAAAPTPASPPPTTLASARLTDLSAAVTSTEADTRINCTDDVHAGVTVTNQGATSVRVTGVRMTSAITSGKCNPAAEFTYTPAVQFVRGNSSAVVLNRSLFTSGSGCCRDSDDCRGICGVTKTFEVISDLGIVPAGSFEYSITFKNCGMCTASVSAATGPLTW